MYALQHLVPSNETACPAHSTLAKVFFDHRLREIPVCAPPSLTTKQHGRRRMFGRLRCNRNKFISVEASEGCKGWRVTEGEKGYEYPAMLC